MNFEEWLSGTNYNDTRKNQLREALERSNGQPSVRKCRHVEQHMKRESYPQYKHARTINSRCDEFKAWSGPIFKSIENVVYKLTDNAGKPYFVKHMTNEQKMKRILSMSVPGRKYYATDFTSFESHFTPEVMRSIEFVLYEQALKNYPHYLKKIKRVLAGTNSIHNRLGVRCRLKGRRMSGDMNTSLGNGFSNLMLCLYASSLGHANYFDGVFEGDDGLFSTDAHIDEQLFRNLGWNVKIEVHDSVETASFCGVVTSGDGNMLKRPERVLSSLTWNSTHVFCKHRTAMELFRAKIMSAAVDCGHCPIICAVLYYYDKMTESYTPRFENRYVRDKVARNRDRWIGEPTDRDRSTFEMVYGISVATQIACEQTAKVGDFSILATVLSASKDMGDYRTRYLEY